ncbi:MAG: CoA-acylating methylmalonate-semialdehyde dehydrogenase [Candidatus Eremiobacteraeota bacterium]|nr:CoA-acylating methylmalonate-semialdehyde dehydrogenase [Candidatus Eremiobacteraeota bacterium]
MTLSVQQKVVVGHYIDGAADEPRDGSFDDIYDPATGEVTKRVAMGTPAEVDRAVAAAQRAFGAWSEVPPVRRAALLFAYREALVRETDRLARIITSEHGKTLDDARAEMQRGIEVVEFACGIPHLLKGDLTENVARDVDSFSLRQPLGVCAGITPFNFPAMVPMWMFPISIACGNTFVLKPSEKVPSLSVELARIALECGIPAGVLNVVHGGRPVVEALLDHPGIRAVSFVGSTAVARAVYARGTAAGKRVQALGGAKNHLVAMPDADLEQTADALLGAAFGSAGERCMAISVAVAVGDVAEPLLARLKEKAVALRVDAGTAPGSEMGPLISAEHRRRVAGYIESGVAEGAELVLDGRTHAAAQRDGFFLGPSIFDRVEPRMRIYREEIFGPVLAVVRVPSAERALQIVNDHELANGAAVFTRSGGRARWFVHNVAAGMVGVNVAIPVPMSFHSFGGSKNSLFGDHHMHGPEGVRFSTRQKTATVRWPSNEAGGAEFVMPTSK